MTDDELEREVRDLLRFRFAATAEDVADALGIEVELAARVMARVGATNGLDLSPPRGQAKPQLLRSQ